MTNPLVRVWTWARYASAHEPFWLELVSGAVTIVWSVFVFWMPSDLADRPPYFVLASMASDETWETIGIALGTAQLAAVALRCRPCRWIVACLLSWWWWVLAIGLYVGPTSGPGVIVHAGWGAANLLPVLLLYRPGYAARRCARE